MNFDKVRIGYVPCSSKLNLPGDRRRFCYYASKRGIKFEIAKPSENYDIVIVTQKGDLSTWSKYRKGKARIVYDFIDSYLAIPRYDLKGIFRGLAKYVSGESRYLQLSYRKAIEAMCKRADAVICSTAEQQEKVLEFCNNVHVILDFHGSVVQKVKQNYSSGDVFNFVWEGLPYNIRSLYEINDVLMKLNMKKKIVLHIVTDLKYYKYMGKYGHQRTSELTNKLFCNVCLHEWNEKTCSDIISQCDLAVIPIPLNDPLSAGKPENKLLLFWRMGMPVVVSATAAYARAMQLSGLSMACRTKNEWLEVLEKYIIDENARRDAGQRGRVFCENNYSEEKTLELWDEVFRSLV
jgi:hypothetical protein